MRVNHALRILLRTLTVPGHPLDMASRRTQSLRILGMGSHWTVCVMKFLP